MSRELLGVTRYPHMPPCGAQSHVWPSVLAASVAPAVPNKLVKCCPNRSVSFEFTNPLAKKKIRKADEACSQLSHLGTSSVKREL